MKIKFGAFVTDGRGKAGGTVFSKNKSGAYAKNKVTPSNPKSTAQMIQRNLLAGLAQAWRGLSEESRQAWIGAVDSYQKTNIFGDQYRLSGNSLYNSLNANLAKVGLASITDPLAPQGVAGNYLVSASATTISMDLFLSAVLPLGVKAVVRATAPQSAGKYNLNSQLRVLTIIDSTDTISPDINSDYIAQFGLPTSGSRIGYSVQVVNPVTGEAGVESFVSTIVA